MGFILFLISFGLSIFIYPISFLLTLIQSFRKIKFKEGLKKLDKQFLEIATSIDANGNVVCDDLFNLIMIKNTGYKFGNRKETISSVLGKNQITHTLTFFGYLLAKLLDTIQKDHCKNSIDYII